MEWRVKMTMWRCMFLLLWMCFVPCLSYDNSPTICNDNICACDGFGKVICVCKNDYEEVTIRPEGANKMLPTAIHIDIDRCRRVTFLPNAITNLQELRSIRISNVDRLTISENSLYWAGYSHGDQIIYPGVNIEIHNTTVSQFPSHSVKGHIDGVLINASSVLNIKPFAFSNLIGTRKIEIVNSVFPNVENQAFKKLSMEYLLISGGYFKSLPSRTFSDVEVRKSFRLFNVTMDRIRSSAFMISGTKKTQIENCKIGTIEGDALRIVTRGSITIRNNSINKMDAGALAGMGVSKDVTAVNGQLELLFENNTVEQYEKDSWKINATSFDVLFKQVKIKKPCDCSESTYALPPLFNEQNVFCFHKNSSGDDDFVNLKVYNNEICSVTAISKIVVISIVIIVFIVIGAVAIVAVFIVRLRRRRQVAWVNGIKPKDKPERKLPVILPDGRTYRETELHVIVEKAQLLTTDL